MKYNGCILEFTHRRNAELMKAFRNALARQRFIDINQVSEEVVNTPCSRFWVSEERAFAVISALLKGKKHILNDMRPTKREMFQEICRRVETMQMQQTKATLFELVTKAVNSKAPKFYMKPRCAMEIIYKIKKKTR